MPLQAYFTPFHSVRHGSPQRTPYPQHPKGILTINKRNTPYTKGDEKNGKPNKRTTTQPTANRTTKFTKTKDWDPRPS